MRLRRSTSCGFTTVVDGIKPQQWLVVGEDIVGYSFFDLVGGVAGFTALALAAALDRFGPADDVWAGVNDGGRVTALAAVRLFDGLLGHSQLP